VQTKINNVHGAVVQKLILNLVKKVVGTGSLETKMDHKIKELKITFSKHHIQVNLNVRNVML